MKIRQLITETESFKSFDSMMQSMILKKTSVEQVQHGFYVSENRGYDVWEKQTGCTTRIKMVVKDIYEKYGNKNLKQT